MPVTDPRCAVTVMVPAANPCARPFDPDAFEMSAMVVLLDSQVTNPVMSSNTTIADISNAGGSKGLAHGFAVGTVTVTAQRGSVTGTSELDVK